MRKYFVLLIAFVLLSAPSLLAQNWKKTLEESIKTHYGPLTKRIFMNDNGIGKPGPVYVIRVDGVIAEPAGADGTIFTNVRNGAIEQGRGSGVAQAFGALVNGYERANIKALTRGERVYLYDVSIQRENSITLHFITVDTATVAVDGRTIPIRFKAALSFHYARGEMEKATVAGFATLAREFITTEIEASAPKTIELGQSIAQVEAILGKPETVVKLGARTIYTYKNMKVIFTDGKVSDVQ